MKVRNENWCRESSIFELGIGRVHLGFFQKLKPFQKLGYEFGDLGFNRKFTLKMHSCSSSSCSGWRKEDGNVVVGGARGGCSNGGPFCNCGMKCVVRTARIVKHKGKEFWGCPKFKNGGEGGGCNYFKWCADHGVVETETSAKCEGKCESFLKREAMEDGWKIKSDLDLSVKKLENRLNIVLGIVCVLCVLNIIVLTLEFVG
ncbi:hypothetical protein V8G54_030134 [Vigna mungo]|uniref:GRF-type domain-containing protein n=1 Tax=Vigna mungo TaxID=3915 RepID=A0AAQ3RJT4_VIGMU